MTTVADPPLTAWERLLARPDRELSAEDARYLLRLDFSPADHARVADLGVKASAGTLTATEATELDDYIAVGHKLARLQILARRTLRQATAGD